MSGRRLLMKVWSLAASLFLGSPSFHCSEKSNVDTSLRAMRKGAEIEQLSIRRSIFG